MFCVYFAALLGVECPQLSSIEKRLWAFAHILPTIDKTSGVPADPS
jgi:hypothetical protein